MQTEDARALVVRVWQAFARRDEDAIAALFAEDAEWVAPPGNATAVALGRRAGMVGARDIARFVASEVHELFRDPSVEFRGFYADGPTVVVEETMSATLPNGQPYMNDYVFVFECEDGRVVRMREYMDTHGGHRQVFAEGHPLEGHEVPV